MIPESTTSQIKTPQSSLRISTLTIAIDNLKYTTSLLKLSIQSGMFEIYEYSCPDF